MLGPGLLKLTHTGSVGPCSDGTSTWDVLMKKCDGYLWVAPNGSFVGKVTLPDTTFPVTVTCPSASTSRPVGVQMNLFIKGSAADAMLAYQIGEGKTGLAGLQDATAGLPRATGERAKGCRQLPGVQTRDGPAPASVSINPFSRLTNAAGSSMCPPSASVA